jgi:DNA mismatch endonuclease (patch repair protein)
MEHVANERRSENMRRIRSTKTRPESAVQSRLHRIRFRFPLYVKWLPGKLHVVLKRLGIAFIVHGCFLHYHGCKTGNNRPKSNATYSEAKLSRIVERDTVNRQKLRLLGWRWMVLWECQTTEQSRRERQLQRAMLMCA